MDPGDQVGPGTLAFGPPPVVQGRYESDDSPTVVLCSSYNYSQARRQLIDIIGFHILLSYSVTQFSLCQLLAVGW